jgi:hypothetical protein
MAWLAALAVFMAADLAVEVSAAVVWTAADLVAVAWIVMDSVAVGWIVAGSVAENSIVVDSADTLRHHPAAINSIAF